jgi:hypothetical protein
MSKLTDEDLLRCDQTSEFCNEEFWSLLAEVREHRAATARLEAWAAQLDQDTRANQGSGVGPFIAMELRNRIKGDATGIAASDLTRDRALNKARIEHVIDVRNMHPPQPAARRRPGSGSMPADTQPVSIRELETIEQTMTPGKWTLGIAGPCNVVRYDGDDVVGVAFARLANASGIAAVRNALPALIGIAKAALECEAANKRAGQLRFERSSADDDGDPGADAMPGQVFEAYREVLRCKAAYDVALLEATL